MIAIISPVDGPVAFVALHLDEHTRSRKRWVPIGGQAGATGEPTYARAVAQCVDALQAQVAPLVRQARSVYWACNVDDDTEGDAEEEQERRVGLSSDLWRQLQRVRDNLDRLLDQPTARDDVAFIGVPMDQTTSGAIEPAAPILTSTVPLLTMHQLRAGRAMARVGLRELAAAAGLSAPTVSAIENAHTSSPHAASLRALQSALAGHGVIVEPGGWIRHQDDARALAPMPPVYCARCAQMSELLDTAHGILRQMRRILGSGEVAL